MQDKQEQENQKNTVSPQTVRKNTLRGQARGDLAVFGSLRALCFAGALAAMSLVLGKYLQIPHPMQSVVRISFENLPVLLAGITLGPLAGAMTGAVADLLGCLLYGYEINPIVTLGAVLVGAVSGLVANYVLRRPLLPRVILSVAGAHLCGSLFVKTAGLAAYYLKTQGMGFWVLFAWRALAYVIIAAAECTVLYLLLRHKGFAALIERIRKKR